MFLVPPRQRKHHNSYLLILLLAVIWSRAWAGVPQTVVHEHDHGEVPASHEEVRDHVLTLTAAHDEPGTGDQEHHHLHICSGGIALVSQLELDVRQVSRRWYRQRLASHPVRRTELRLKPPRA